jgi:hypothetical protein
MQITIRGTADEIASTIAKIETLLTVYEQSRPAPIGLGLLEVRVAAQL